MERIVILPRSNEIDEFLNMEESIYKNIIYNRETSHRDFTEADLIKTDDGKIHYALNIYKIKRGKKYYLKLKSKKGFTVDEKGKLKVWYGSDLAANPHFSQALKALKIDWFSNEENILWPFITKTLFEKVITGKITNPIDYLSGYLKLSRISASPKLFYEACKKNQFSTKLKFLRGAYTAKDVNHFLEYILNDNGGTHTHHLEDLINQSKVLDRKIDFKWSSKRMDEEHIKWTKDIMQAEITSIPDKEVSINLYERIAPYIPDFFEPLNTQKRVFMEGTQMQHCVYTNYWNSINSGDFLAYHISWKGQEATLGLYISNNKSNKKLEFSQLFGKRNSLVSKELRLAVVEALDNINDDIDRAGVSLLKVNMPENNIKFLPF
jgi:hypothetical protein